MENYCKDCGVCCLNTEMLLFKVDINLILNIFSNELNKEEFLNETGENSFQLKNINGHCYFFNEFSKTCKIYEVRPQGCRFYPMIYDNDKKKCVNDVECPRTHLFYQNQHQFKNYCKELKEFLIKHLKNDI